jgi:rhamnose utilization protein RhaD (predicted bifunctional aldolase and dehydrogenase)
LDLLAMIVELSHQFGTSDYVRGGGGNTSVKDAQILWVKPSGTTLCGLKAADFVAMDRGQLAKLYAVPTPAESQARETLVKDMMAAAVKPGSSGRPSVEAPLHDSLDARFVVHTHPAIVNGLTCAKNGKAAAAKLFPAALWIDYTDPGYTLCMRVRQAVKEYQARYGKQPEIILLENHGIFISSNCNTGLGKLYQDVFTILKGQYNTAGVSVDFAEPKPLSQVQLNQAKDLFKTAFSPQHSAFVVGVERFAAAIGPISPDHIVYSKSFPFVGRPAKDSVAEFVQQRGYEPAVVIDNDAVYGLGSSQKSAQLALELAIDGAMVMQYARAFGGVQLMTDRARAFIENWEVESYRKKQMG